MMPSDPKDGSTTSRRSSPLQMAKASAEAACWSSGRSGGKTKPHAIGNIYIYDVYRYQTYYSYMMYICILHLKSSYYENWSSEVLLGYQECSIDCAKQPELMAGWKIQMASG
jgi:hypothetical protein